MKFIIVAALLVSAATVCQAQETSNENKALAARISDPELREATEQALSRRDRAYEADARDIQSKKGELFAVMRVEVTVLRFSA